MKVLKKNKKWKGFLYFQMDRTDIVETDILS